MNSHEREVRQPWPPLANGTSVETTSENSTLVTEWADGVREQRQWGETGEIIDHSDSHGLAYLVRHVDQKSGWYDPSEFRVLAEAET